MQQGATLELAVGAGGVQEQSTLVRLWEVGGEATEDREGECGADLILPTMGSSDVAINSLLQMGLNLIKAITYKPVIPDQRIRHTPATHM